MYSSASSFTRLLEIQGFACKQGFINAGWSLKSHLAMEQTFVYGAGNRYIVLARQ